MLGPRDEEDEEEDGKSDEPHPYANDDGDLMPGDDPNDD